jgi:PilZ domain-containing protein
MGGTPGQGLPVQLGTDSDKRRRSDRVLAPTPIRVIGNDMSGVAFSEDAVTVSFNQQGARISLTHTLLVDDVILILNKKTNLEDEFRVVGAFQQVSGDRREWGVEVVDSKSNIWGIDFVQPSEELQPKALIECGGCKHLVQSPLSSIEYDVLLAVGMISRHCDRCKETTRWKPSTQTVLPEILEAIPKKPGAQQGTRRVKRINLVMRVRVRNAWGIIDVAQTRNVSKLGLCFLSSKVFSVSDEISLVLPFTAGSVPVETKGKVVWSRPTTGGRYYGVEYLKK